MTSASGPVRQWAIVRPLPASDSARSGPLRSTGLTNFIHRCPFCSTDDRAYHDGGIFLNRMEGWIELGSEFCAEIVLLSRDVKQGEEYDICQGWKKIGTVRVL